METGTRKEATMPTEIMTSNLETTIRVLKQQAAEYMENARTCQDEWLRGYFVGRGSAFGQAIEFIKEDMGKGE